MVHQNEFEDLNNFSNDKVGDWTEHNLDNETLKEFWKFSPLDQNKVKDIISSSYSTIEKWVRNVKNFPKDDLDFLRVVYIYNNTEDKYQFVLLFDPYSSNKEFNQDYKNGLVDEEEIYYSIFSNKIELKDSFRNFVGFYDEWISGNGVLI